MEKSKNAVPEFSRGQWIRILCLSMMPLPHPSTSSLQPPNPVSSHSNNNNNNGGLHACVRAGEDIERVRVIRAKYYAPLSICWAKKYYGQPTSHFHCLVSPSTACLYTACKLYAHAPSLLLHFWWISNATYRLEYELQRVESFSMDPFGCKYSWNDAKLDAG